MESDNDSTIQFELKDGKCCFNFAIYHALWTSLGVDGNMLGLDQEVETNQTFTVTFQ